MRYDESEMSRLLESLPNLSRALFAASSAQVIVSAQLTAQPSELRNGVLSRAVEKLWEKLLGRSHEGLALVAKECEALISENLDPLTDDSLASIVYALRCADSGRVQEAVWAARRVYETVDSFLQRNERSVDERLLDHPVVRRELSRQRDLLHSLPRSAPTPEFISRLRATAIECGAELFSAG